MTNRLLLLLIAFLLFALSLPAAAQTVYKSVDADGRVTYSATPPPNPDEKLVQEVQIAPGPTEEQRRAALERARQREAETRRAERGQEERRAQRADAIAAAERELHDAQTALAQARMQSDNDFQRLVTGARVPKQSYLDRVARAEERVREAEQALRQAKSGRR